MPEMLIVAGQNTARDGCPPCCFAAPLVRMTKTKTKTNTGEGLWPRLTVEYE